jgi:hypothetical protein
MTREVRVGLGVLDDDGHAVDLAPVGLDADLRRADQVALRERRQGGGREVPLAQAGLEGGVAVDLLDDAGVEAHAGGEGEVALAGYPEVHALGLEAVGHAEEVLGGVDHVVGDAECPAEDVGGAAGQGREGGVGAGQAVGGLVDGAVAAEGDDHVVALFGRLPRELGCVGLGLGVDRVDLVAPLEGVDDQVLEPVGDRARVRVHDHEHAALVGALRQNALGERLGALERGFLRRHRGANPARPRPLLVQARIRGLHSRAVGRKLSGHRLRRGLEVLVR